jgi:MOSC domain-containing protein YiiM
MEAVSEIQAVAGHGLEGDRYWQKQGTFSDKAGPDREITLIETEALEGLAREYNVELQAAESRRNLATRGVPLNHLVGQEFTVGTVRLRGIRLCEPCSHLAKVTGRAVLPGLVHRGGLRAQVLTDGVLRAGDRIRPSPSPSESHGVSGPS